MRIAPGGPFDAERKLPPDIERNVRAAYDLDKPLTAQFTRYLSLVIRGDFGPSFKNRDFSVSQLIALGAPISMEIGLTALALALMIGLSLGILGALQQNQWADFAAMSIAFVGISIPTFVTAPALILVFAVMLRWLPAGGWESGNLQYVILPIATLALPQIAVISRLARSSLLEILRTNFVRTARAKGLSSFRLLARHVLRAGLSPIISYLGPAAAALMTGSLVIERLFGLPGIGRYFVEGAINRDYTIVLGVVIIYAALVLALNLLADICYRWLDPRVGLER